MGAKKYTVYTNHILFGRGYGFVSGWSVDLSGNVCGVECTQSLSQIQWMTIDEASAVANYLYSESGRDYHIFEK